MSFTPGPWDYFAVNADGRGLIRIEASVDSPEAGHHIASMPRGNQSEDNAEMICRAVNAFDDMKAALIACQKALAMMTSPASISVSSVQHAWTTAIAAEAKSRTALSKAEGHIGQELAPGDSAQ